MVNYYCKWYKISSNSQTVTEIKGHNGNQYFLSAQDIGYKIKVEVYPQEKGYDGIANVTFDQI